MEKVFHANGNEKKAAVAILISDKIDFKTRDKEETLHYDKRINPRRKYNNYKYIYTQHRSTEKHKANINKCKGKN